MYKIILLSIVCCLCFTACENSEETDDQTAPEKKEVLVEVKDGIYTEWYPGKKNIKFKGGMTKDKKRTGRWVFYSENGTEMSSTMYENGIREGFTIVKYPNGGIHYRGEYKKDVTVGIWTTYDEKGNVTDEKDFGYPVE
jgi:antitoxin component YwqK of YwqJK toxin-antitoxin module